MPDRVTLEVRDMVWPYATPFAVSRGVILEARMIDVRVTDGRGCAGHGEAMALDYRGENVLSMRVQLEGLAEALAQGMSRNELMAALPAGSARFALDTALWDLEAKQGLGDPFSRNRLSPSPVTTAYTIGIRSLSGYEEMARALCELPIIKVKVDSVDPVAAVAAVRRAAPLARLIVDPNQAWTVTQLRDWVPAMEQLKVDVIEQPIRVGYEGGLDGYHSPVPLCADELLNDIADLPLLKGRFQIANIKLEKAGGLTAALHLAEAARDQGLRLMVGCMGGTSLAMAPGMVLAQRCDFVDLDGPHMMGNDRVPGFAYDQGRVAHPHDPAIWG